MSIVFSFSVLSWSIYIYCTVYFKLYAAKCLLSSSFYKSFVNLFSTPTSTLCKTFSLKSPKSENIYRSYVTSKLTGEPLPLSTDQTSVVLFKFKWCLTRMSRLINPLMMKLILKSVEQATSYLQMQYFFLKEHFSALIKPFFLSDQ